MNRQFTRAANRIIIAVVSAVLLSLTAMTGGTVPAGAEPDTPITPTPVENPVVETPGAVSEVTPPSAPVSPVPVVPVPAAPSAPVVPAPAAPSAPVVPAPAASGGPAVPVPSAPEVVASAVAEASVNPAPVAGTPAAPQTAVGSDESNVSDAPAVVTESVPAPETPATAVAVTPVATSAPKASDATATSTAVAPGRIAPAAAPDRPSPMTGSSEPAEATQTVQTAQTLTAPADDVGQARSAQPVEVKPEPAALHDVARLTSMVERNGDGPRVVPARAESWDHAVRQWNPDWVHYDEYHRPVIANPYRDSVRIAYVYDNTPRIAVIPPLASIVLEAARLLVYSFTAIVVNALNTVVNVAVGSFLGGGFVPAAGLPLPAAVPLARYDNVPVQVRYSDARYQPFVVRQIVDTGDDPQYGERRVLLDGATPVWGQWTQTGSGQRQFEVHRTQQFPGLTAPREVPLPGEYRMRLAADNITSEADETYRYLAIAAAISAAMSLALVGLSVYLGRRHPQH